MNRITQQQQILAYCTAHGSITIREAFDNLNINSPTKRISEMRNSGLYHVETAEEKRTDEKRCHQAVEPILHQGGNP